MDIKPMCFECVLEQARSTAERVTEDEKVVSQVLKEVMRRLISDPLSGSPAEFSMAAYDSVREITGAEDPYREEKRRFNQRASQLVGPLKKRLSASRDPLYTAARLAAAGNVIDLGIGIAVNVQAEVDRVLKEGFAVDHFERFRAELKRSSQLVYFLDNAGEIVFDKLFMECIRSAYPTLSVVAVVKSGPIINDATMEDAAAVELTNLVPVISTGVAAIGVPLARIGPEARRVLLHSDLVMGKGQGNFETLNRVKRPFYAILKAKCPCVAQELGVGVGDTVFMRRPGR